MVQVEGLGVLADKPSKHYRGVLLDDSFTCANGICENNCKSTIMDKRRSN